MGRVNYRAEDRPPWKSRGERWASGTILAFLKISFRRAKWPSSLQHLPGFGLKWFCTLAFLELLNNIVGISGVKLRAETSQSVWGLEAGLAGSAAQASDRSINNKADDNRGGQTEVEQELRQTDESSSCVWRQMMDPSPPCQKGEWEENDVAFSSGQLILGSVWQPLAVWAAGDDATVTEMLDLQCRI